MSKNNYYLTKASIICSILLLLISGTLSQFHRHEHNDQDEDKALDVVGKSPTELIELRGFESQEHKVTTEDGYILQLVRIVNPLAQTSRLKRPVIFNHGLIESATIWLINSHSIKPRRYPALDSDFEASNATMINAPMMLANEGYDVWLLSMRGTDFSQDHVNMSSHQSAYWDYCLDDFALKDIPATIEYIRQHTGSSKVGYVGHSQATFSIFGLLATRPEYADIVEPVAAFAPVAFIHHTTSVARPAFLLAASLPFVTQLNMPSPLFCPQIRAGEKNLCDKSMTTFLKSLCMAEKELISGLGQDFKRGFHSHFPFYSSLKTFRHFGQLVSSKRYCMYNYGKEGNMKHYNSTTNPDYDISRIRSKSLAIFWTAYDTLAPPKDVKSFVRRLKVPIFRSVYTDDKINHMDIILSGRSHEFNRPLLEIFEHFENGISPFDELEQSQQHQSRQLESNLLFENDNEEVSDEPKYNTRHWNIPGLSIKTKTS